MSYFKLSTKLKHKLHAMPRGRYEQQKITNSCCVPYNHVSIDNNGDCFLCFCDGFLPIPVGNVLDFKSLEDLFTSRIAKVLQKDISNKKFTWCAVDHCGIKHGDIESYVPMDFFKYYMSINVDDSCNLACPSCRTSQFMMSSGPEFDRKLEIVKRITSWLDQEQQPVFITLTGNGDPLASHIIRPLIKNWTWINKHQIELKTNGLLAKKQLAGTYFLNSIARFSISIDAGSADVYEDVRRPGKWNVLIDNLDFVKQTTVPKLFSMVLQNNNYFDLENFYNLCREYNARPSVIPMSDWGTWPDFSQHNVLDPDNPNFNDCKRIYEDLLDRGVIDSVGDDYIENQLGLNKLL
mgnify:CR=1 FL=1